MMYLGQDVDRQIQGRGLVCTEMGPDSKSADLHGSALQYTAHI
jgi:hypothetical protein